MGARQVRVRSRPIVRFTDSWSTSGAALHGGGAQRLCKSPTFGRIDITKSGRLSRSLVDNERTPGGADTRSRPRIAVGVWTPQVGCMVDKGPSAEATQTGLS
jgi:hypothetical protein